jgi:Uma2 family endonuclease
MAVRHAFTVEEWHRMGETGLLGDDARMELLDGEVIEMSPIGSRHAGCVNRLTSMLVHAVGDRAVVAVQNPVGLDDRSEPVPDVAVLRPRDDAYSLSHPQPGDVVLLVEVADSSLAFDRGRKALAYARAGVAEVWVVDLAGETVEVMRSPRPDGYGRIVVAGRGGRVDIERFDAAVLAVEDILGPLVA